MRGRRGRERLTGLHVGVRSAQSAGVKCHTCGLTLPLWCPDDWPEDVRPGDLGAVYAWAAREAVLRWNRRAT